MKLGIFGGSFDPFHFGHLRPVLEAVAQLGLDRVYFVPTGRPPHKPERELAPPLSRYAMTELGLLDHERLWVSTFELSQDAPSYTVDTLLHFRQETPEARIYLLVGGDSFAELRSWYRWERILEVATLAVMARSGWERERTGSLMEKGRVCFVDNAPLDISSTEIRRRLSEGRRPPGEWMPAAVVDFVAKYRLYR